MRSTIDVVFHALFIRSGALIMSLILSRNGQVARPQAAPAWGDLDEFAIEVILEVKLLTALGVSERQSRFN